MNTEKTNKSALSFITIMILFVLIIAYLSSCVVWYNVYVQGQYYAHATVFMALLFGAYPIYAGIGLYFLCKYIIKAKKSITE